jgi:ubiquitin-protein ligase
MNRRLIRLANDYREISQAFFGHPSIGIKNVFGDPPEKYHIEYKIKGVEQKGTSIVVKDNHVVEIMLTLDYPQMEPICRMLTPIFHPNISPSVICIADHWAAGESLADVIVRIGQMISYQNYNIKSPRNGEAARWAEKNIYRFPIDTADLSVTNQPEEKIEFEPVVIEIPKIKKPESTVREEEVTSCANCGARGQDIQFQECSNGHVVCSDCVLECRKCGKILCVLCSFDQCSICDGILCGECRVVCISCNNIICEEHLARCTVCEAEGCSRCFVKCPQCNKLYCKNHFVEGKVYCTICTRAASDRLKIPEEKPPEPIQPQTPMMSILNCPKCGYRIEEAESRFCIMCGTRFK